MSDKAIDQMNRQELHDELKAFLTMFDMAVVDARLRRRRDLYRRRRAEREQAQPADVFVGVPGFLRASLRTAASRRGGYREPGYQHGRHVRRLAPHRVEDDAWEQLIDAGLVPLAEAEDHARVGAGLHRHFPGVLARVPKPRLSRYVAGFIAGLLDE